MSRFVLSTWNCFGAAQNLVSFVRWRGAPDSHRFDSPNLTEVVEEADVVCMQEVFLTEAEAFFSRLSHGHKRRDHNATTLWPLTFGGSGLGIASRFAIKAHGVHPFSRPHTGAERFARKGMLHAHLVVDEVDNIEIDVITTHLQSGYYGRAAHVRRRQVDQLRELVATRSLKERATIICGDLNIDGLSEAKSRAEYDNLRNMLDEFADLGAHEDRPTFHPEPGVNDLAHRFEASSPPQRIDYVLFRPGSSGDVRPTHCELSLNETLSGTDGTFPSDHFGLKATFEIGPVTDRAERPSR
ncbi:MAG: endonuclease/exonuclease/phosphatase family protein [Polyangiaceae bacterium]